MELLVIVILCVLVTAADGNSPTDITVKVGKDVVLPCSLSSKEDLTSELFEWKKDGEKKVYKYDAGITYGIGSTDQDEQFEGRVLHFKEELKKGIASIKILRTSPSDSGTYTCEFPSLKPPQNFSIKLVVDGGDLTDRSYISGAASKPTLSIINGSGGQALLQCEVNNTFPKPAVELKDSSGNKVPAKELQVTESKGTYNVMLQATVTKEDRYTCVVTQQDIRHQTEAWTFVPISGSSTGVIIGSISGGILLLLVVVGVLV